MQQLAPFSSSLPRIMSVPAHSRIPIPRIYNEFESQFIKLSDKLKDVAEFERYYRTDMCESRLEWDANVERIDARAVRKIVYKIIRYISPLIKNNNGSFI